jgi:UDP:flavonoid glycosyltransferase YjiC (YdhE family)
MARIVCITSGLSGILHASYEIAHRLQRAGHEVVCASWEDVAEKYAAQGIEYAAIEPINFRTTVELPEIRGRFRSLKRLRANLIDGRARRKQALHSLNANGIEAALEELHPDLLLIDLELHDYILTAVAKGIPTVLLSQWFSIWERPNLPPIHHATRPGVGWQGHRIGIKLAWLKLHLRMLLTAWKTAWRSGGTDRRSTLYRYARQIGFPTRELSAIYQFPPPLVFRSLPVIALTAWALEFPHAPRPNLHYAGPMVCDRRQDIATPPDVEDRIRKLIRLRQESGAKLIYCSISTMGDADLQFVQRIVDAVAHVPDWVLIVGLGRSLDTAAITNVPDNVHFFDWAPQLQVLEHADCSINHGGIHTIHECIHFGVPMLIYSGKKFDQNGCAARVAYHQLGIMADREADDTEMIRRRIRTILDDSSYKERVLEMRSKLQSDEDQLAEIVEQFLSSLRPK